ncbi:hypothetical protein D3C85_1556890 [compost metagenome]
MLLEKIIDCLVGSYKKLDPLERSQKNRDIFFLFLVAGVPPAAIAIDMATMKAPIHIDISIPCPRYMARKAVDSTGVA